MIDSDNQISDSKKSRKRERGFPLIRLFLITSVFALGLQFGNNLLRPNSKKTQDASFVSLVPRSVEVPAAKNMLTHIVKPGDTFLSILSKYNVKREDAIDCYRSLKPFGCPALFPGDSLIVKTGPDGSLKTLSLLSRLQHWYKISTGDSMVTAERAPVKVSSYSCILNGTLESSLSEDLHRMGVNDGLTSKFADIFAWDINFFLDPRKGDSFQILFVEKFAEGKFIGYGEILGARYTNNGKDFYAIGCRDEEGRIKYYDLDGNAVQKQFLKAPLKFSRISSRFSLARLHPVLGIVRPHKGIDYAAPTGTPVYAAADGRIAFSGWKGGFGKYVEILHGASYVTAYGHLNSVSVRSGQHVEQGDLIGTVGATGLATGAHLDYRMRVGSCFVNPLTISLPSSKSIDVSQKEQFENLKQSCLAGFGLRFTKQSGCHVLHIDNPPSEQPAVNQVNRTQPVNGTKPNS